MLIYLASPYSHAETTVRAERFDAACAAVAAIMQAGGHVISPIVASHPVAVKHTLPGEYEYWRALDRDLIARCDELWVLTIDGWSTSTGIADETAYALERGMTVRYVDPLDPAQPMKQP